MPLTIDGIAAGNTTRGHRFMATGGILGHQLRRLRGKAEARLRDAGCRGTRRPHLAGRHQHGLRAGAGGGRGHGPAGRGRGAGRMARGADGGRSARNSWSLPPEVLQTSMQEHQKFFSVRNPKTGRIEKFVTVANTETADHGATILAGNQKVLSARLSDAKFFWENDLRMVKSVGLEGMAEGLANVTFHNKLGSQADRIERIEALAREIAPLVGAKPDLAAEAARVAKADLQSAMVGEFPELQGVMGSYYAEAAGLPEACRKPARDITRRSGLRTPCRPQPVSVAVALADKIDTLTGFWAIDEKPTGIEGPLCAAAGGAGGDPAGGGEWGAIADLRSDLTLDRSRFCRAKPCRQCNCTVEAQVRLSAEDAVEPDAVSTRKSRSATASIVLASARPPRLPPRPPQGLPPRRGHPPRRHRRLPRHARQRRPDAPRQTRRGAVGDPEDRRRRQTSCRASSARTTS